MSSTWKPLLLHRMHSGIPSLLVKYEFGTSDYKIWLTDLSYVWTESLDRRQILRRALNVDTSIDPSEDHAQLRLFLGSIEDALRQRPGTSVSLDESNDIKQLTLQSSTSLPGPLQPLEWSMVLTLASQSTFALEFVSPLLSWQLTAKVEKASLLQQLKEKDNVIAKLIDKIQGDGVDLGKIFPGAVSSKSGTGPNARRAVAKSVKGLGGFDQDEWQSQLVKDNRYSRNLGDVLPQVFGNDGKKSGEGLQIPDYGEWWKIVGRTDLQRKGAMPAKSKTEAKQENLVEDEFQRHSTPSTSSPQTPKREELIVNTERTVASSHGIKEDPDENNSTTDESDDDLQSCHSKPLLSPTDDAVANDSANFSKGNQSEPMDLSDDGLAASTSNIDSSPAKTYLVPKTKPKLGKIGGKGKDSSPENPALPTSKPKLGKIGGKGKLSNVGAAGSVPSRNNGAASNKAEDPVSLEREGRDRNAVPIPSVLERRGRTVQQPSEASPPRETSQERANRKREQLKRELESKSQPATKKKRRF